MIGGIFLTWFADAVLFGIMVKTEFQDPVESPQDLADRDMSLSKHKHYIELNSVNKLIFSSLGLATVSCG